MEIEKTNMGELKTIFYSLIFINKKCLTQKKLFDFARTVGFQFVKFNGFVQEDISYGNIRGLRGDMVIENRKNIKHFYGLIDKKCGIDNDGTNPDGVKYQHFCLEIHHLDYTKRPLTADPTKTCDFYEKI